MTTGGIRAETSAAVEAAHGNDVRVSADVLSTPESVALTAELAGRERVEAEPAAALRVAELCGRLPLALRIVAERAASQPSLALSELVEELLDERRRLDALASAEDELSDTRAVFSWSYRALTPPAQRAFRLLGLHAGPEIGVPAAAALLADDVAATRRELRALASAHLLQELAANRFRLHDLLRSYARERSRAEDEQADRTQAVRRVLSWYLMATDRARRVLLPHSPSVPLVPFEWSDTLPELADGPSATRWFERERLNLLAAQRQAAELGQFDLAWKLPMVASGFFELGSHWAEWAESHQAGVVAARTLGDKLGAAANLVVLGDTAWRLRRHPEASEHYTAAASGGRELGVAWLEGFALRGLGLLAQEQGDIEAAAARFHAARAVFSAGGLARGEGMSLLSLGRCARERGETAAAVDFGERALAIFNEIEDGWTLAWGRLDLAASLADAGRPADAIAALRAAAQSFAEFGDARSEAKAQEPLGDLLAASGDADAARACWRRAAELLTGLDDDAAARLRARIDELG